VAEADGEVAGVARLLLRHVVVVEALLREGGLDEGPKVLGLANVLHACEPGLVGGEEAVLVALRGLQHAVGG
jgi:hypothetical protein